MRVTIQNLTKRFGETVVLKDISLEVQDQELFFLLGPSGCGKTTLLRLIAGFDQPEAGRLLFGGRLMNGVPPHERNTGLVFQNYALWPHLTVAQNVAYGLDVRAVHANEKRQRVAEALGAVRMEAYAERTPNQLSGGQQQRVALARALVIRPDVLLLDEPLSNLDARLRLEMREEIRRIHDETRITTIYVTHDQKESLSLADRVAVMRAGIIEQIGCPREIYRAPASRFVADFIGEMNWLAAEVRGVSATASLIATEAGEFHGAANATLRTGQTVRLGFRPEAVAFGMHPVNCLKSVIIHASYLGEVEQYELRLPSGATIKALEQNPVEIRSVGESVAIHVRPQDLIILAGE